jgi:di/tricarboxylate transporter
MITAIVLVPIIIIVAISLGASPTAAIIGTLIFAGLFFGHGHD